MACKYCHGKEPLLELGETTVRITGDEIKGIRLVVESYGASTSRPIDYCPWCGEQYRPFGPAWGWDRSP